MCLSLVGPRTGFSAAPLGRTALWLCSVIAAGCGAGGQGGLNAPAPSNTAVAAPKPTAKAQAIEEVTAAPPLALSFKSLHGQSTPRPETLLTGLRAGQRLTSAAASKLRLGIAAQPQTKPVWLKLDSYPARRFDPPYAQVALADLAFELDEIGPGTHRLLAFTSGDASVCRPTARQTILFDIAAEGSDLETAAAMALRGTSLQVLSPFGTFNGPAEANSALLCFLTTPPEQDVLLTVVGPGGAALTRRLSPGSYAIDGLSSGDYSFHWSLAPQLVATSTQAWGREKQVITVNLDAPKDSP